MSSRNGSAGRAALLPLPEDDPVDDPAGGEVALPLLPDDEELLDAPTADEDENGFEKVVALPEGGGVGKEMEVLVAACAQNCSAMFSAGGRSLEEHEAEMQSTRLEVKRVELRRGTGGRVRMYMTLFIKGCGVIDGA